MKPWTRGNVSAKPRVIDRQFDEIVTMGFINRSRPQWLGPWTDQAKREWLEWFRANGPDYFEDSELEAWESSDD